MPPSHVIAAICLVIAAGALVAAAIEKLRGRQARRDLIAYILYHAPQHWTGFPPFARRFFAGAILTRLARTELAGDLGFAARYAAAERPTRRTIRFLITALVMLLAGLAAYRWADIARILGL